MPISTNLISISASDNLCGGAMFMTPDKRIRNQFDLYTSGRLGMTEFRHWFAPFLRDVHKTGDTDLEKFANAVEWEFLDCERGLISESELKRSLGRLVDEQFLRPESVEIVVDSLYFAMAQPKVKLIDGVVQVHSVFVQPAPGVGTSGSGLTALSDSESSPQSFVPFTLAAPA